MHIYQKFFETIFSKLDPELVHTSAIDSLKIVSQNPPLQNLAIKLFCGPSFEELKVKTLGMNFNHPLGLAGGFDKDACCVPALEALGFSFLEIGTVTPKPQPGNARPRLFRLIEDQALINRLGFPSKGAEQVFSNLNAIKTPRQPICISLGKNKDTDLNLAGNDYCAVLKQLVTVGDMFSINVSSPNTPGLVKLQNAEYLREMLAQLNDCMNSLGANKPFLLKISPDLKPNELDTIIDVCLAFNIKGIIATNTTQERIGILSSLKNETGGLSGVPLRKRSTEVIRHIYKAAGDKLVIVGVGGIFTAEDAWEKILAGASLLQAYTGFIYEGPAFVKNILLGLHKKVKENGFKSIQAAVGTQIEKVDCRGQ